MASAVAVVDSVALAWEGAALQAGAMPSSIALNGMRAIGQRVYDAVARLGEITAERVERRLFNAL